MRLKVVEDLVVTEVGVSREDEEFVVGSYTFQRQDHDALLDHVKFREVISILDDIVAREVNPRV